MRVWAVSEAMQIDPMTVAAFLAWAEDEDGVWQLVDGYPVAQAATVVVHGMLVAELIRRIGNQLADTASPCRLVAAPGVVPARRPDFNFRIPDIAVSCSGQPDRDRSLKDPVLIIEVLSPSNAKETWLNVWAFTTMPSVQEILVVRSDVVGASLLGRGGDGSWPAEAAPVGDTLTLASVGLTLPLVELYRGTALG